MALGLSAGAARADGELHLYNWSNYFPPELMKKFEKETGTKVTIDNYASEEDLLAKLQAGGGGYDIVFPTPTTLGTMIKKGLVAKIEVNQMTNFGNILPKFKSVSGDENRDYSAPYMWGTTGFTYDPSKVPDGKMAQSWKGLLEPDDSLKGKIGMLDDMADVWNAAAYYLGIDKCTEDPAKAQKILDLLQKQKPFVKVYSNDGTIDRMIAGEVAMHMQWNGAAHRVKEKKPDDVYVYPKEGVTFWTDLMVVPANAPDMENAKTFINWMMKPENAAIASNYTGYSNTIKGSNAYLKPELKDDPAVNAPEDVQDRLRAFKECSPKSKDLRERVWTKLKS
ncbi:extracellular solute-binding protein [Pararhizobium mangrovi]|uniref:Extracellular solute-binding protein n=2 Tax=Pararhizobium mangrovi TaxID=2590452 RepID=A0A506U4I9_9HYPH|nr:extracellular solute-binding protein [Pararhizobium mangrovi]